MFEIRIKLFLTELLVRLLQENTLFVWPMAKALCLADQHDDHAIVPILFIFST